MANYTLLTTVFLFIHSWVFANQDPARDLDNQQPVHVRVIWTENPMEHAIISWTTLFESNENIVHFDTLSRKGEVEAYAFSSESSRSGKVTMKRMDYEEGVPPGYYHHAELHKLKPGTTYYFVVESKGRISPEYHFISARTNADQLKILTGGDSRLGGESPRYAGRTPHLERQKLKTLIGKLVEQNPDIMAFVHGADYGTTADWRHLYWYFEDLQLATTSEGRILPLIISMGNHDTSIGFFENFYLGEELNDYIAFSYYYTTQLSDSISLFTLNTEIALTGHQYQWLKDRLPQAREQSRWLLVNYHKPAFPAHKDPDDYKFARVREHWVPLFEQYRIDLAIESDGHTLKRTPPILRDRIDKEGIVYIGEGGLGAPLREPYSSRWYLQGGFSARLHHVWMVDINDAEMTLQAIDIDGNVVDEYIIRK